MIQAYHPICSAERAQLAAIRSTSLGPVPRPTMFGLFEGLVLQGESTDRSADVELGPNWSPIPVSALQTCRSVLASLLLSADVLSRRSALEWARSAAPTAPGAERGAVCPSVEHGDETALRVSLTWARSRVQGKTGISRRSGWDSAFSDRG